MSSASARKCLGSLCREMFSGWSDVQIQTSELNDDLHIRLRVSGVRLAAARNDYGQFLGELFEKHTVEDLARKIVLRQRGQGFRRYGRKRR